MSPARLDHEWLWAPHAWLPGGWQEHVLLRIGADGHWAEVNPGVHEVPRDATVLQGPVLPGLVNAHSHAFQRAFAGLTETRDAPSGREPDNFWSWRDRMYDVARRISCEQLRAIAAQLYVELLRGGYTQVCEFHYLQHASDGRPHDDPLAMSWALADAAGDAGIGLTLLPVLYERAGFEQPQLRDEQRRFATSADSVWSMQRRLAASARPLLRAGIAIHSLRAAAPESIRRLRALAEGWDGPIHVHAAEQLREIEDCVASTGARPIEWLARENLLDERWQLVHATHATRDEIESVALSGAGVVLCPSTEANLGDGLCDLSGWLASGASLSIGSDSHVTRAWREELRLLEYGQRLVKRERNVAAAPEAGQPSTAQRLWSVVLDGSAGAAGLKRCGLQVGARADLLVIDGRDDAVLGVPAAQLIDALVFSSPGRPWRDVMVAGRFVVQDHRHEKATRVASQFEAAMQQLWDATACRG
jgi:formimidoylglutamate deiminase